MDDAQFEQGLDQYAEQLLDGFHVIEKNGDNEGLKAKIKEKLVEEIELEILDRVSDEKSKEIDEKLEAGTLGEEELRAIIESENIDYNDVVKKATERFRMAFGEAIEEQKGGSDE